MQAVILAGGLGTRLRASVSDVPKPMAPIADKPFLAYILQTLKESGITEILILTGYKGEVIETYFGTGELFGLSIQYCREPYPLGTGGALMQAWVKLKDTFLLINGDTFFDIQYRLLLDFAVERQLPAVMSLCFSEEVSRYGLVRYDDAFCITSFIEKGTLPPLEVDGYINGGIYYFQKNALQDYYINWQGDTLSLELDILPGLMKDSQLFGLPLGGKFIDIGTPESYKLAQVEIPACLAQERQSTVFLDRDGVIIQDTKYPSGLNVIFLPEAFLLVQNANQNKQRVLVVTNQAGVAKGCFREVDVLHTHEHIYKTYLRAGLYIDDFFYCPYHPDGTVDVYRKFSNCRKPLPGLFLKAAEQNRIDWETSYMVGDNPAVDCIRLPYLRTEIIKPTRLLASI